VKYVGTLALSLCMTGAAWGQDVTAAKAGLIHYIEGDVTVAGKSVVMKPGDFPEMKKGEEMRTADGRAEILLGPGVFLRVSENSAFVLHSSQIENTRLELTAGSMLIEAGEFNPKLNAIVVKVGANDIEVAKRGLYRIDFEPGMLKVFDGAATLIAGGQPVTVKEGRQVMLSAVPNPEKFNTDRTDAFHRWASRRSSYIAVANIAAAKRIHDNGSSWGYSNWMYNPYLGCYTFIPANGMFRSPFGWAFYSPRTVERVYYRPPVQTYNPNPSASHDPFSGGGATRSYGDYSGRSSMGSYSSGGTSAPPPAAAAPAADGGARGGGDAGGGRSTSGGR
jgi:hypothetical protein